MYKKDYENIYKTIPWLSKIALHGLYVLWSISVAFNLYILQLVLWGLIRYVYESDAGKIKEGRRELKCAMYMYQSSPVTMIILYYKHVLMKVPSPTKKAKLVWKDKQSHYILVKGKIQQKEKIIVTVYTQCQHTQTSKTDYWTYKDR